MEPGSLVVAALVFLAVNASQGFITRLGDAAGASIVGQVRNAASRIRRFFARGRADEVQIIEAFERDPTNADRVAELVALLRQRSDGDGEFRAELTTLDAEYEQLRVSVEALRAMADQLVQRWRDLGVLPPPPQPSPPHPPPPPSPGGFMNIPELIAVLSDLIGRLGVEETAALSGQLEDVAQHLATIVGTDGQGRLAPALGLTVEAARQLRETANSLEQVRILLAEYQSRL